ncbi:StbB family protein [Vibrio owensii]|uniref:StbB family protein n=1 Tax=Vibrio harveyi group TaxID=717610 RepID=UPI0011245F96|nr:StbB family protein [Vibrio parahaemolyticus]TOE05150.1 transcriptional regulator [Vibrio parahaemolyticus]TOE10492.1 transcriptional regulator [Vibrio parahaemolyticus]TOE16555.1 transcriptional regulator [Vibrio parahaemolyticus]CAH1540218.1 Transcriptional regulator [Vibrio harveyi]
MYLNIAVVNNSGNVGKSTICDILLKPRLEGAQVVKVETINSDGTNDEKISAEQFEDVLNKMDEHDCSIIDVGSSNIENFLLKMQEFKSSHEDIDYFLVPVTPSNKQQVDSVTTIQNLMTLGIEPERVKVVFNMANKKLSVTKEYAEFLSGIPSDISLSEYSVVFESTVFDLLAKIDRPFLDVLNDKRDYRSLIRQSESKEERSILSFERSAHRLVNGFNDELDHAFSALKLI